MAREIVYTAITEIPDIRPGDNLAKIITENIKTQKLLIHDGDIFVIAQKIVSKSENRFVNLRSVKPSLKAKYLAWRTDKDSRLIQLVLGETRSILRLRKGTIIVEHKNGYVCANAGIDHSNSRGGADADNWVLLLPNDSDQSAERIRIELENLLKKKIGIAIIDSHGRAWRNGTVGITIGVSRIPGVVDLRGKADLYGYRLKTTQVGAADELAAGASLLMGQANEKTPVIHVRGFPYPLRESSMQEIVRERKIDLFR